jgi:hypothetical protein
MNVMMSMKLGNNLYSGGATVTESMKKAYLYADKISKESKVPVIINMSFGIGSEIEGQAEYPKDGLWDVHGPFLFVSMVSSHHRVLQRESSQSEFLYAEMLVASLQHHVKRLC